MCTSVKSIHEVTEERTIFLGSVTAKEDPWITEIAVAGTKVKFKIDTGAVVTATSEHTFKNIFAHIKKPTVNPVTRPLIGPGGQPLEVIGMSRLVLQKGEVEAIQDVYVIKNLQMALLGRPAITRLVTTLDSIDITTLKKTYPRLCSGLGVIKQSYAIKLQPNAVPFSLKTLRRIPLPLVCKVKE